MTDAELLVDRAPLQDRDLLQRMSQYFDAVDHRLRNGEGWIIFNARDGRSHRISRFIEARLSDVNPPISCVMMPWRDFALSAYVTEVGLPELAPGAGSNQRMKQEFDLATRVTVQTWAQVVSADLLVLAGMKPTHRHEATMLDRTLEQRFDERRATILMTPDMPQDLAAEFGGVVGRDSWDRLFGRLYERSLVAL